MVGGADGPMVLFTSLALAKNLFVPITVVAYLYLGLTYGGYPYLVKLLVPKKLRAIKMVQTRAPKNYSSKVKLAFEVLLCAVLSFLFPVASPLFFSLFLGVAVRESGMKHIQDFVFTDGTAEQSVERRFAQDLDSATEVCVYAKLPKGFEIPTPVGNYSPDWAIAFFEGTVKHIYFIAETKGSMSSLDLRPIETAKIRCAKRLFNEISTSKVKYHDVDSYQSLLNIMGSI